MNQPETDAAERLDQLLAAMPMAQRGPARLMLTDPRSGGRGLRAWLAMVAIDGGALPGPVPGELVDVYLNDGDAEPLHDCERCGLAVPVRAARRWGHEATVEREYFPTCPHCGGRTGRYAFWSRRGVPAAS